MVPWAKRCALAVDSANATLATSAGSEPVVHPDPHGPDKTRGARHATGYSYSQAERQGAQSMSIADESVGIPWYRKRDYQRILAIMTDRANLPRSYENWRSRAEILEKRLQATGRPSVRALIEPKNFARWCAVNRLKANAHARLLYIEESLREEATPQ
jgi:hypothetical protein